MALSMLIGGRSTGRLDVASGATASWSATSSAPQVCSHQAKKKHLCTRKLCWSCMCFACPFRTTTVLIVVKLRTKAGECIVFETT